MLPLSEEEEKTTAPKTKTDGGIYDLGDVPSVECPVSH